MVKTNDELVKLVTVAVGKIREASDDIEDTCALSLKIGDSKIRAGCLAMAGTILVAIAAMLAETVQDDKTDSAV